ncbi:hypothetical protein B0G57_102235 [Trinickia symbiotica]|nr:hypothetical protein [Trinickia symbiotica]PPK46640.1 hypothetical protein B0G57_102235 [Trinickia symbiotica]
MLATDRELLANYDGVLEKTLDLSKSNASAAFTLAHSQLMPLAEKLNAALVDHRRYNAQLGQQGSDDAAVIVRRVLWLVVIVAASTMADSASPSCATCWASWVASRRMPCKYR